MAPSKQPDKHLSNPVMDTIYGRRSVRKYSDKDVPDETIREIIRAGTYAPTAVNKQPWRFVVIKNRKRIDEYDERAKKIFVSMFKDEAAFASRLLRYAWTARTECRALPFQVGRERPFIGSLQVILHSPGNQHLVASAPKRN